MSKASGKRVLEWVAGSPGTFAGGAAEEIETLRLELGLRDDEIAEIHKIIINTQICEAFPASTTVELMTWLSMDPDSAYAATLLEDLETILMRTRSIYCKSILVGVDEVVKEDDEHVYNFDTPILVGTDLGMGLHGVTDVGTLQVGTTAEFRVFFTRRRANASELNQILLKRR